MTWPCALPCEYKACAWALPFAVQCTASMYRTHTLLF